MDLIEIIDVSICFVTVLVGLLSWLYPRHKFSTVKSGPKDSLASDELALLVTISIGLVATETDICILVEAANPTPRPLRLVAVGLQLQDESQVAFLRPGSDRGIPCVLRETDKVLYWASAPVIAQNLVESGYRSKLRVRGFVRDTYDQKHYNRWTELDPQAWAKS